MKIVEFFIKQSKLMNLIIVIIILVGIKQFFSGQKEAFPAFTMNDIWIVTVYPGASATTVENLVTYPIEEKIRDLTSVKKVRSSSKENVSTVIVTVSADYENRVTEVKNDLSDKVGEIMFPDDVREPEVIVIDEGMIPILNVLVAGGKDEWELREKADLLEKEIRKIDGVGGVSMEGYRDEEIVVEVDPAKLENAGISMNELINAIRFRNLNIPSGKVFNGDKEYLLRVQGSFYTADEIRNIIIRANDDFNSIKVKDVAKVINTFNEAEAYYLANGKEGIFMEVRKNSKGDNIEISEFLQGHKVNIRDWLKGKASLKELLNRKYIPGVAELFMKNNPGIEVNIMNDTAVFVRNRLNVLSGNATIGLIFVVIILFIFFDLQTSFWTMMGMPVAFSAALIAADFMGITLNMMSMFALIIVVGMIVDDAIVVAEAIYQKMETGMPPLEAAIKGTQEVMWPIIFAISTTIAAFIPLLLVGGFMGKFMSLIPKVVTITLLASLVECLFVLPGHLVHAKTGNNKSNDKEHKKWFLTLKEKFSLLLKFVLKHKWKTVLFFTILFFVIAIGLGPQIPFNFFPGRVDQINVNLEMEDSYSLEMTRDAAKIIEKNILANGKENYVRDVLTQIGMIQGHGEPVWGENHASINVLMDPKRPRTFDEEDFKAVIGSISNQISGIKIMRIESVQGGPPKGKAINVVITGNEFDHIQETAEEMKKFAAGISNAADIQLDWEEGKTEYLVEINEVRAYSTGLSPMVIANAVKNAFDGGIATIIKHKGEEIDVRVKYNKENTLNIWSLHNLKIANMRGRYIHFTEVAKIIRQKGVSEIKHYNSQQSITLYGALKNTYDKKYTSSFINKEIKNKFGNTSDKYPDINIQYSGENEEMTDMQNDLKTAGLVAVMLIFFLLVGLFKSYSQPLIIMITIPFGVLGVMIGLFIHKFIPPTADASVWGFMTFAGLVALTGVVVNDAIIMIDCINNRLKEITDPIEAIISAAVSRLRPIILTTITTVVGLIPMSYGIGGSEVFIQPMGITIMSGLIFATTLTLIFVPVLYYIIALKSGKKLPQLEITADTKGKKSNVKKSK